MTVDKAGKGYWDHTWENEFSLSAVDPYAGGLNNYLNRGFHEYFRRVFSSRDTTGQTLLEIGSARSAWLPYFAREFGFEVRGIDYSEIGCRQAEQVLSNEGVEGEVVCADFFSPPGYMLGASDVVVSFGVAEHFEDTRACIEAFSRFLRPGGLMVTIIPNLSGTMGYVQRAINRPIFDIHVPLDRVELARAHSGSGLDPVACEYFLFASLSIINIENLRDTPFYSAASRLRSLLNKTMWTVEKVVPLPGPNRWTSPYIACTGTKKPCA